MIVGIVLFRMAHGLSAKLLADRFGVGACAICNYIDLMNLAFYTMSANFWPNIFLYQMAHTCNVLLMVSVCMWGSKRGWLNRRLSHSNGEEAESTQYKCFGGLVLRSGVHAFVILTSCIGVCVVRYGGYN